MPGAWEFKIGEARRTGQPVQVNPNEMGLLPPGFQVEANLGPVYRVYKRERPGETVVIQQALGQCTIKVEHNAPTHQPSTMLGQGTPQPGPTGPSSGLRLLVGAVATIGAAAGAAYVIGRALQELLGPDHSGKVYKLFISHSWAYSEHYQDLEAQLVQVPGFEFQNFSIPREKRLDTATDAELHEVLARQIIGTSAVVIISGMYTAHSDWIDAEIDLALQLGKPIIGVKPEGNQLMPRRVQEVADAIVDWDALEITGAIDQLAGDS